MPKIKFRAWITEVAVGKRTTEKPPFMVELSGIAFGPFAMDESAYWNDDDSIATSGYHLMQYTGLKDKNGTEIYEGDIVKESGCLEGNKSTEYYEGKPLPVEWYVNDIAAGWNLMPVDCGCLEVIGNIHENPKLLEANDGNI